MKRLTALLIIVFLAAATIAFGTGDEQQTKEKNSKEKQETRKQENSTHEKPLMELAILLDTSGSMSGLINQAQAQLWNIVNQMATARKDGEIPKLRVALYEYGKSSLPKNTRWVRRIVRLSGDLDKISSRLFQLKTNGGKEYCGEVIQRSLDELEWSDGSHYKAIYIAGNEPFTQGPTDYRNAVQNAINRGIVVNTIHCGSDSDGRNGKWAHAAELGDGRFLTINHNSKEFAVDAPQDKKIIKLNSRLNETYLPFGPRGQQMKKRQKDMDHATAEKAEAAAANRAIVKSKEQYNASSWDLVDALERDELQLSDIKKKHLPEELKGKTREEQKEIIQNKRKKREELQKKIQKLEKERRAYVRKARKEMRKENTLGSAIEDMLKEQLKEKGFEPSPENQE